MKKSNLIIGSIGLALLGVVIVCLAAFRARPEFKAERDRQRHPALEQQVLEKMTAFAARCSQVEELVLESSASLRGQVSVSDSSQFKPSSNGEVKIDTILENGGKKLTLRIEPQENAQIIYYDIQLLLPLVTNIRQHNVNMRLNSKRQGLSISVKGEAYCHLQNATQTGLQVDITDLCALYNLAFVKTDSVQIRASGNALVYTSEEEARQMQQSGKLILTQNAIVRWD